MSAVLRAFDCFVGAWGFLNGTIANATTGELLPDWHSVYPSGISVYGSSGYFAYMVTANDTTQPEYRPRNVTLPAQPDDDVQTWATIAQHAVAAGGPFTVTNATNSSSGPAGTQVSTFWTSTLPAWVGYESVNEFRFWDDCSVHMLRSYPTEDTVQTAFFFRQPDNRPS